MGTDVAVKQIFRDANQEKELQQYIEREINLSKYDHSIHLFCKITMVCRMRHPHLVQLIGVSVQDKCVYLVTELITGMHFPQLLN